MSDLFWSLLNAKMLLQKAPITDSKDGYPKHSKTTPERPYMSVMFLYIFFHFNVIHS